MIGHVVFNSAYATIVIQARMATLSETLEQAAADLGATPVAGVPPRDAAADPARGHRRRAARRSRSRFDNVVTSLFLGGPNAETLPVLLLGLIRLHVTPEVNAIGVLVMLDHDGPARARGGPVQRARRGRRAARPRGGVEVRGAA